jgi:hypothetical protein
MENPADTMRDWLHKDGANRKQDETRMGAQRHLEHGDPPMAIAKGKTKWLMSPLACMNFHPFMETLRQWEEGVPIDCGEAWTSAQIEAAFQQGPHKLALDAEARSLIAEDVAYQVRAGYAQVVLWDWLKTRIPPQLKVLPIVVPQRNWRGHMILSLSFPVLSQIKGLLGRKPKWGVREVMKETVNNRHCLDGPQSTSKGTGQCVVTVVTLHARSPARGTHPFLQD